MNRRRFLAHLVLLVGLLGIPIRGGQAQQPVVYAILFFSPSCGHCHYVMDEVFPSLKEQYAEQLQAIYIDVSTTEGSVVLVGLVRPPWLGPKRSTSTPERE